MRFDENTREPLPVKRALGEALRRTYHSTVDEAVPEKLRDLLKQLD